MDQTGQLRYIKPGEGDYGQTESLIRDLLSAGGEWLPATHRRGRPHTEGDHDPRDRSRLVRVAVVRDPTIVLDKTEKYTFPARLPLDYVSFQGVWTNNGDDALAGAGAAVRLRFQAKDVYSGARQGGAP